VKWAFVARLVQHSVTRLGEISQSWAILFFGLLVENYRSSPNFLATFFHEQNYALFEKKWVGLHFWRFFHKLICSPWWPEMFRKRDKTSFAVEIRNL
jgi:hypothetical protein